MTMHGSQYDKCLLSTILISSCFSSLHSAVMLRWLSLCLVIAHYSLCELICCIDLCGSHFERRTARRMWRTLKINYISEHSLSILKSGVSLFFYASFTLALCHPLLKGDFLTKITLGPTDPFKPGAPGKPMSPCRRER